jgi:hypothetical protein
MRIDEYPRPPEDTGLGIHLGASCAHPMGEIEADYQGIANELKAMGFKWAKLVVGPDSGLSACRVLAANGIMPIVRFYEQSQWPDALCDRHPELGQWVRAYVAAGARYFETGNEPNLLEEWDGGWGDSDADPTPWKEGGQPDRVIRAWARDARVVLDNGGLPGIPALSPGGHYNDVDCFRTMMARLKLDMDAGLIPADILSRGAWIAIHNGTLNHPLDYPGDAVNQTGVAVSEAEYGAYPEWAGSRDWVNAERQRGKNPGQHLLSVDANGKDAGGSNCWDKFRAYEAIFVDTFGFELPILGTEGGVWVGTKIGDEAYNGARIYDPRYPAVTKEMQRDWTVEICRRMMAGEYPAYYLCTGFWLYANKGMGNPHMPFERDAWYSFYWPGGQLPVVAAMKALPKQARPVEESPAPEPVYSGQLSDAQVAEVCRLAGFVGTAWTTAVAVALAESGGRTDAVNATGNTPASRDRGLFQINDYWHGEVADACAFDALCSAREAYRISEGGKNWWPWSAYALDTYQRTWDRAEAVTCGVSLPTPEQLRKFAWEQCIGVPEDAGLMKRGRELGLVPICGEGRDMIGCGPYVGQVFTDGQRMVLLYCRDGQWDTVYQEEL